MDILLRQGKKEDYAFLWDLHKATMKRYVDETWGWDQQFQKAYFDERFEPGNIQIIEKKGVSIGAIEIRETERACCIVNLKIDPDFQNRGIGTALLKEIMNNADRRHQLFKLHVLKVNPAKQFYERLGFKVVRKTETHFIMEKRLA